MGYILIRRGIGDGCDYTIGCNQSATPLKATTIEEARLEAIRIVTPDPASEFCRGDYPGSDLKEAIIVQTVEAVDIESIYVECEKLTAEAEQEEEKRKFLKMKAKFEGS